MAYTYLDWRPFEYYTAEGVEGRNKHLEMFLMQPVNEGEQTLFTVRLKLITPLPQLIRKWMVSRIAKQQYLEFLERSKKLLKDYQVTSS